MPRVGFHIRSLTETYEPGFCEYKEGLQPIQAIIGYCKQVGISCAAFRPSLKKDADFVAEVVEAWGNLDQIVPRIEYKPKYFAYAGKPLAKDTTRCYFIWKGGEDIHDDTEGWTVELKDVTHHEALKRLLASPSMQRSNVETIRCTKKVAAHSVQEMKPIYMLGKVASGNPKYYCPK